MKDLSPYLQTAKEQVAKEYSKSSFYGLICVTLEPSKQIEILDKGITLALQLYQQDVEKINDLNNALVKEGYSKMEYYEKLSIQLKAQLSQAREGKERLQKQLNAINNDCEAGEINEIY